MPLLAAGGVLGVVSTAGASDTGHTLVVDGVPYASYKHSGAAIHFNTPNIGVSWATFNDADVGRNQVWAGHGSEHMPCAFGMHWINNSNVLTISHCLEDPNPTTVPPTTVPPTTVPPTTVPPTTVPPTTVPPTTVPPTTVPPTTVPPTTVPPTTVPPTTALPTTLPGPTIPVPTTTPTTVPTTTAPTTTAPIATTTTTTTTPTPTGTTTSTTLLDASSPPETTTTTTTPPTDLESADTLPPIDPAVTLPATGLGASTSALFGAALLALGLALVGFSRRPQVTQP